MGYWRITSTSLRNLEIGLRAGQWGAMTEAGLHRCQEGDKVAFYVSRGKSEEQGYWATAVVKKEVFSSSERLWEDGHYPYRLGFAVALRARRSPVPRDLVLDKLGQTRFAHQQPRSLMRLEPTEYAVIERLLDHAIRET